MQTTMAEAKELTLDILKADLVPSLVSSPGIGKSSIARQIAEENNLFLIDHRLTQSDPIDLQGALFANKERTRAGYIPLDIFPLEGKDKVPEGYKGWLVLLDEFPSAPLSVQAAAYKIILDKMVGQNPIHRKCAIIVAGNKATDKAIVNRTGTAMQTRMIWLEIGVCQKAWLKWADHNDIDHRVKSFIRFRPEALHRFDPNHNEHTFACPRTWEFVSKLIKPFSQLKASKLPLLAGAVGEGTGREFFSYTQIYDQLPSISDILSNPAGVRIGDDPSIQYALAGLVSHHMTSQHASSLMKFVERLSIDFQVIVLRSAVAKDRSLMHDAAIKAWVTRNSKELAKDWK